MSDAAAEPQRSVTDLPKAHLHLHFTGSMRVETVRNLAMAWVLTLPCAMLISAGLFVLFVNIF